jgi:hypothetical protein
MDMLPDHMALRTRGAFFSGSGGLIFSTTACVLVDGVFFFFSKVT